MEHPQVGTVGDRSGVGANEEPPVRIGRPELVDMGAEDLDELRVDRNPADFAIGPVLKGDVLADLVQADGDAPIIPVDVAAGAVIDGVIATHPNAPVRRGAVTPEHPDGLYPVAPGSIAVTLADVASDFADLGTETVRNLSAHSLLARQDAQSTVSKRVGTTLSLYQGHLEGIEDAVGSLKTDILNAIGTDGSYRDQIEVGRHHVRIALRQVGR